MAERGAASIVERAKQHSSFVERVVDRVLLSVSPKSALRRAHRRLMVHDADYADAWHLTLRSRGYKIAQSDPNATPWLNSSSRTADGELLPSLRTMRARGRELERDDSLATGIVGTKTRNVVGSGLRPQARLGADRKAAEESLEASWRARAPRLFAGLTIAQAQRMIYARREVDGDVLLVASADESWLWIEVVESDRLLTPSDAKPALEGGRIAGGVEQDRWGRPVAYWIALAHPGDTYRGTEIKGGAVARVAPLAAQCRRVPAERARLMRSLVTRPGQSRGQTIYHAVAQDLHDLDLLVLAALKRTQIAACLALFITSDGGDVEELLQATAKTYGYQLDQTIEPGMFFRLYPGEEAAPFTPTLDVPDLEKFVWTLARRIGAGVGLSPQTVLREWAGISYSGARTIKIDDNLTYDLDRADLSEDLSWCWRMVQEDALLRGELDSSVTVEDLDRVQWVGDAREWVDPRNESEATALKLQLGLTTLRDEALALGKDWEELQDQRLAEEVREKERRQALGLPPKAQQKPASATGDESDDESAAEAA